MQEKGIEVVQYSGPIITAESMVEPWSVTLDGDVVTLTMQALYNEADTIHRIVLLNVPGKALPVAPAYTFKPNTDEQQKLIEGTVAIQDWDPVGVMSGSVQGATRIKGDILSRPHVDFIFWAEHSEK